MIIITGQTSTGKTKLALDLAKKLNTEIINCDSRQCYRYLNIITGKDLPPDSKFTLITKMNDFKIGYYELSQTRIWLYDMALPNQTISSFDWVNACLLVINILKEKRKKPIIVGGSYFYIDQLINPKDTERISPDLNLRKKLNCLSVTTLQKILLNLNKKVYEKLNSSDQKNPRRLIRRIEIEIKKRNFPNKGQQTREKPKIDKIIGLKFSNNELLTQTIKNRIVKRIEQGAISETKWLLELGYKPHDPGLLATGYQQIIKYLLGEVSLNQAIELWLKKEVQYAKRQYTFMKKNKDIEWILV